MTNLWDSVMLGTQWYKVLLHNMAEFYSNPNIDKLFWIILFELQL